MRQLEQPLTSLFSPEAAAWICKQEQRQEGVAGNRLQVIEQQLKGTTARLVRELCDRDADERTIDLYVKRLWHCVEYHWGQLNSSSFESLLAQLSREGSSDVLRDVILAQAIEDGDPQAAHVFENEYMPIIRRIAFRMGGHRAQDCVDNFAAELVLPRGTLPPRIALFAGKTSLANWLKVVVANYWTSQCRATSSVETKSELAEPDPTAHTLTLVIDRECEGMLSPLFKNIVRDLDPYDRVLLQMLILDSVPQQKVASALGIHSGNVTRRRERIASSIWQRVKQLSDSQRILTCLDQVLAGRDAALKRRLGELLAAGLKE